MRLLGSLFFVLIVVFVVWPYYHLYRLDNALGKDDMNALSQLVDIEAVRANYKRRLERGIGMQDQSQHPGSAMHWLQQNMRRLGEVALEQTITLEWIRDNLKEAAAAATDKRPAYFLAGVDFAFFESWDSFIVRLGELGAGASHVRMRLKGSEWRITDIIR